MRASKDDMESWIYNALWAISHEKEAMDIFSRMLHDKENPVADWLLDFMENEINSVKAERFKIFMDTKKVE